ncbi:MAG: DUF4493 domain-containing protein [Parabacteroides merdae]
MVQQSDTVQSYDRFDEMPSEIELKEGAYTLIASKGDNLPSAFENPYFEGSTDFTVKADMSTPIDANLYTWKCENHGRLYRGLQKHILIILFC